MQTISIFVGLNDPNISTVPKYFILLASEKKIYFSLYVKIRTPNFLRALSRIENLENQPFSPFLYLHFFGRRRHSLIYR